MYFFYFFFICGFKLIFLSNTYVFFGGIQNQSLEFIETVVNTGTSAFLHDGLVRLQEARNGKKNID